MITINGPFARSIVLETRQSTCRYSPSNMFILCLSFFLVAASYPETSCSVVNDDVIFQLNWPGSGIVLPGSSNVLLMTTAEDEQYQCLLPDEDPMGTQDLIEYTGPSATVLVQSQLLQKSLCTIRIEPYWNYELCHGQHVRQYHESKVQGSHTKVQQFFLGNGYRYPTDPKFEIQNATSLSDIRDNLKVPTFFFEGKEYPYFEVIMGNGTACDLKEGVPRLTRVHYICDREGRNEIVLQEESSTCEYRVVVVTPFLCSHPLYKTQETPINTISCHPLNGAPSKPDGLRLLESSSQRRVKVTSTPVNTVNLQSPPATGGTPSTGSTISQASRTSSPPHIVDEDLALQFLRGEHCLTGGKGWWQYEFCYKKYAKQYHVDKNGRTEILLGTWNEAEHKIWWTTSKKKHTVGSKTITHFYSFGELCDLTGQPRQVQVKLKCKENLLKSAVSLYLIEPSACNYILGVESSLLCPMFLSADDFGLF